MFTEGYFHDRHARAKRSVRVEKAWDRSQFVDPMNADFFGWWGQVNGGRCPYRHQFDVTEHPKWVSRMFVIGVETGDIFTYRYHLVGEEAINLLGRSNAGRDLSDTNWSQEGPVISNALRDMMNDLQPVRFFGNLELFGRGYIEFEAIDAPFLGKSGAVNSILGMIARIWPS